jgi:hypothetical protein
LLDCGHHRICGSLNLRTILIVGHLLCRNLSHLLSILTLA